MNLSDELKTLKVFSEKLGEQLELDSSLKPVLAIGEPDNICKSWLNNGWSNSGSNWVNNGWSNSGSNWMNNGWSNSGSNWMNSGWSNSGSSWTNNSWSNSGGSGCFITTACVEHMGLSDNCNELTILRSFRDKLVEDDPVFREQVLEYYRNAPTIVKKISESKEKDEVLEMLYHDLVEKCVTLLQDDKVQEAKEHYVKVYRRLEKKYNN